MRRNRGRLLCSSCYRVSGFAWCVFGKWTVPESGGHVGMPCSANEPFECIGGKWRRRNKKQWIVSKS